jgi:hypothetical protein
MNLGCSDLSRRGDGATAEEKEMEVVVRKGRAGNERLRSLGCGSERDWKIDSMIFRHEIRRYCRICISSNLRMVNIYI